MPPTAQFCGDLVDRTAPPADPDGHPPGGSRCQQRPLGTKRGVLLDERSERTPGIRARPAPFPPPQHAQADRTPADPPTQLSESPSTTPTRHSPHTQDGPCGTGSPPHSLTPTRSTSLRPTNNSHMRAGISFHKGPPGSDVSFQHPIIEDPSSLPVDSNSPPGRSPSPHSVPKSPFDGDHPLSTPPYHHCS